MPAEAVAVPTTSGADSTMVVSKEKLPIAAKQEVVVETAPPADVPPPQVDEAGYSGTVASLVTEAISQSVHVPFRKP